MVQKHEVLHKVRWEKKSIKRARKEKEWGKSTKTKENKRHGRVQILLQRLEMSEKSKTSGKVEEITKDERAKREKGERGTRHKRRT